jgi:hypothetical protein
MTNKEDLADFLQDLSMQLRNGKITLVELEKIIQFYVEFKTPSITESPDEMMKYAFMGWHVYNHLDM